MLAVLPMQFALAAAATYCRHETGGAKHFGHHEHRHHGAGDQKSSLAAAGEDSQKGTGFGDFDCEYCHLSAAHPVLHDFAQPGGTVDCDAVPVALLSLGTRDPDRFDRPNWTSLA